MLNQTESITLKSTFFETWHRTTQKLQHQELIQAKECIRPHIRHIMRSDIDDTFNLIAYLDQLDSSKQFDLIKNMLLVGKKMGVFFGWAGEDIAYDIQKHVPTMLARFTETQRTSLAQIDVERNGISVLEKYALSEELKSGLINTARKRVKNFLPPLTDELIIDCVRKNEHGTLQHHIYNRFSGKYHRRIGYETEQALQQALCAIHIDSIDSFLDVLNRAKTEQEQAFLEQGCFQYPSLPCKRPEHWVSQYNVTNKDTPVPFSHGGGFFHIIQFLTGKSAGYRLESPGTGIQVSTETHEHARDKFYSEKAQQHFDYPARLSGTIKAEYLDSAPNLYEAGLRANFIDFIEDIVITRLDTGQVYRIGTVANQAAFPVLDQKERGVTAGANPSERSTCTIS